MGCQVLTVKREIAMYDYDEMESIVVCNCTLLYPRKGQTEGALLKITEQRLSSSC